MLQEYFIKYKKYIFVAVIAIVVLSVSIVVIINSGGNNSSHNNQAETQYYEETTIPTTEATTEYVPPKSDNIMLNFNSNEYTKSKKFDEWAPNVRVIYFTSSQPESLYITNDTRMVYADSSYALDISQAGDGSVIAYIKSAVTNNGTYYESMYIAGRNGPVVSSPSCSNLFGGLSKLVWIEFGDSFDTSNCVSMKQMFKQCYLLSNIDVSNLDTSNVVDMSYMFYMCGFETLDLSGLNTSKCTNMSGMFAGCNKLKNLNISSFDTSSCSDMSSMFSSCYVLETLDLSNIDFSANTRFNQMFGQCYVLKITIDITDFNFSKDEYDSNKYNFQDMFLGSELITVIYNGKTYTYNETGRYYDADYGWNPLYDAIRTNV